MSIPVGVLGASGFLGGELLRLLAAHPEFQLAYVAASEGGDSRRAAGAPRRVEDLHPNLRGVRARGAPAGETLGALELSGVNVREAASACSLVLVATPPEVAAGLVPQLLEAGAEAIADLSPAHRLRDADEHARYYPRARRDEAVASMAVYGLPELARERLHGARLIAAPGCFATAITLAMLPLRELRELVWDDVTVDAKSGSSGSGHAIRRAGMHALRSGGVSPYAPIAHRHAPEVMQSLREHGVLTRGRPARLAMSAYGIDAVRGLSASVYMFVEGQLDAGELTRAMERTYEHEPFVRVQHPEHAVIPLPDPKTLIGSNFCDVGAFADSQLDRVLLIAALDNLLKGGAGQAIQACNVRYGLPEHAGLEAIPPFPA